MRRIFFISATIIAFFSCVNDKNVTEKTVRLKGELINMGTNEVRMSYNGASSMLGDKRTLILRTDTEGTFDTTFVLNEPSYFNISRNTLYLSPGDILTVKITQNNNEAEFFGTSAGVNNYMKERLFPKGGSFLGSGENIKDNFNKTKAAIDSMAAARLHQLDTLYGASALFKKMEKARIQGDIANSYISYLSYAKYRKGTSDIHEEEFSDWKSFTEFLTPLLKPIFREISHPELLDVAVVRDVFSYASDSTLRATWFADIVLSERTQELFSSVQQLKKLSNNISQEKVDEVKAFAVSLKNKDFADELNIRIGQASKLLPGNPAINFTMEDENGTLRRLSDFKGKILYIDLWATWCGPCLQESPFFVSLAEKYSNSDVVFIPISMDRNQEQWHSHLKKQKKQIKQYHSVDNVLQEDWNVKSIPRFILIDANFNIVNAYAARPSSKEIEQTLNILLNDKSNL